MMSSSPKGFNLHAREEHADSDFGTPLTIDHPDLPGRRQRLFARRPYTILNPGFVPMILLPTIETLPDSVFIPDHRSAPFEAQDTLEAGGSLREGSEETSSTAPQTYSPATAEPVAENEFLHGSGSHTITETEREDNAPLRLRGGCPSDLGASLSTCGDPYGDPRPASHPITPSCPCCNMNATSTHDFVRHFRMEHANSTITPMEAAPFGCVLCECGALVKSRGFAQHQVRCTIGRLRVQHASAPGDNGAAILSATPSDITLPATVAPTTIADGQADSHRTFSAGAMDKYLSLAVLPGRHRRLPPNLVKLWIATAGRLADAFVNNPSDDSLLDFLALVKVGLVPGMRARQATAWLAQYPDVDWPKPETASTISRAPAFQAIKYVEVGRPSSAMRALEDKSPIADPTTDTFDALRALHPTEEDAQPIPRTFPCPKASPPEDDDFLLALNTFRKDTAPGLSGWTWSLLNLALKDMRVVRMFRQMAAGMLEDDCAGQSLLTAAALTPLIKATGGIRPIAVGDLVYRLCAKAILRKVFKPDQLAPFQFGVGSPAGVEPIIHLVRKVIQGDNDTDRGFQYLTSIDIINAYNTARRGVMAKSVAKFAPDLLPLFRWTYGRAAALVVRDDATFTVINATTGVRQGDNLGPLFFSIAIRSLLESLASLLGPRHRIVAYLDDIYILSPEPGILDIVSDHFDRSDLGLKVNQRKSKTLSIEHIKSHGIQMLGGFVGPNDFQAQAIQAKADGLKSVCALLPQLPSQHAFILFRMCAVPRLRHLLRTTPPEVCPEVWTGIDSIIRRVVSWFRWSPGRQDIDNTLISLPMRLGGLGIMSFTDVSPLAYQSSLELSNAVLSNFVPEIAAPANIISQHDRVSEMLVGVRRSLFDQLTDYQRGVMVENASQAGRRWLSSYPSNIAFTLTDCEIAMALRHRTLTPFSTITCGTCDKTNIAPSHDESCSSSGPQRTRRHEAVKYAVAGALKTLPNSEVEIEPLILHGASGTVGRRNDIRFSGSVEAGLGPMEFDVKVTGLGVGNNAARDSDRLFDRDPIIQAEGRAERALAAIWQEKVDRLPAFATMTVARGQFHPIIFSAGGMMDMKSARTLNNIKRKLHPGTYSHMLQSISCGLARRRGRSRAMVEGGRKDNATGFE